MVNKNMAIGDAPIRVDPTTALIWQWSFGFGGDSRCPARS
jgi:hypothetical protein